MLQDWLESVMRLLLGCPIHVQLPLDAYGMPDFMDAWWVLWQLHFSLLCA